jgi:endonuclease I
MGHPLTPKLSDLSAEDLSKKISELTQRLNMAYRWGRGDIAQQIYMMLEDYNYELQERNRKQMEEMSKKNPGFDKLIDIK